MERRSTPHTYHALLNQLQRHCFAHFWRLVLRGNRIGVHRRVMVTVGTVIVVNFLFFFFVIGTAKGFHLSQGEDALFFLLLRPLRSYGSFWRHSGRSGCILLLPFVEGFQYILGEIIAF